MKLTRTQQKCAELKNQHLTNKEIAEKLKVHIKTVEFHLAGIKARTTTTYDKIAPMGVVRLQWYLMPSQKFAQVLDVSEDLETITVAIHQSIATARTLIDGSNQAELSREFLRRNCQLWDVIHGKRA
jgi:orotate phosphoribosyltransferase-like protein